MDAFADYGSDDSSEAGGKDVGDDQTEGAPAPAEPLFKPAWQVEEDDDDSDDEAAAQKAETAAKTDGEAKRKGRACERLQCRRGGAGGGGAGESCDSGAREQRPACERKPHQPPRRRSCRAH